MTEGGYWKLLCIIHNIMSMNSLIQTTFKNIYTGKLFENKQNTKKDTKLHYYISLLYAYTAFH
jgi:hypothetical protein